MSKGAWLLNIWTVHLQRAGRFLADVDQFRNACLQAERHLVLCDSRECLGILESIDILTIQFIHSIQHHATIFSQDTFRVLKVEYRIAGTSQGNTVVSCRQKATSPHAVVKRLAIAVAGD